MYKSSDVIPVSIPIAQSAVVCTTVIPAAAEFLGTLELMGYWQELGHHLAEPGIVIIQGNKARHSFIARHIETMSDAK